MLSSNTAPEHIDHQDELQLQFHQALAGFDFRVVGGYAPYRHYIDLLLKWNKAYNLTAIRDPAQVMSHHVIDSLAITPYLQGEECLDVGTGAGLPGLILAIANPNQFWTLIDSNIKKTRFVAQAIMELKLKNVEVIHMRIEEYDEHGSFDTVVCRAYTCLSGFYQKCRPFIHDKGVLLAMKSAAFPKEEVDSLKTLTNDIEIYPVTNPVLEKNRGLIACR